MKDDRERQATLREGGKRWPFEPLQAEGGPDAEPAEAAPRPGAPVPNVEVSKTTEE